MTTPPDHRSKAKLSAHVTASAALLDIPLTPSHREEAVGALAMIMAQADLVLGATLPDAAEAAPRFRP